MSGSAYPWFKFDPEAWRNDKALALVSIGARGLWVEMLCLMHQARPYGHLLVGVGGRPLTDEHLSILVKVPLTQLPALLGELEDAGVFSRNRNGVIYSRRMCADEKKARIARRNGKAGGNPSLCKKTENKPSVKGGVKGGVKLKDSKDSKKDSESSLRSDSSADKDRPVDIAQMMVDIWNDVCGDFKKSRMTPARRKKLPTVLKRDFGSSDQAWRAFCRRIAASDFLSGRSTEWQCDLDWCLKPAKLVKISEGDFDNRTPTNPPGNGNHHGQRSSVLAARDAVLAGFSATHGTPDGGGLVDDAGDAAAGGGDAERRHANPVDLLSGTGEMAGGSGGAGGGGHDRQSDIFSDAGGDDGGLSESLGSDWENGAEDGIWFDEVPLDDG
jgi:hypothetical protein